jgi:hypothetical protein
LEKRESTKQNPKGRNHNQLGTGSMEFIGDGKLLKSSTFDRPKSVAMGNIIHE